MSAPPIIPEPVATPTNFLVGPKAARPTWGELVGAPYVPPMIVDGYLQQDASGYVAPGGSGKSTILLFESIHFITGRELYGRRIVRPGGVLVITAEDSREVTLSRLNQICNALNLSKRDQAKVRANFYVEDVSASPARLVQATRYTVEPTAFVDEIIAKYGKAKLAAVTVDPASMLGPGEMSGNDGMAQFMRTARRLSVGLNAAIRVVHHVAQAVARGKIADQYAGRGGTAFADNSRGQHQLMRLTDRTLDHEGSKYKLPPEISDDAIAAGWVFAIFVHKLSYALRDPTPIVIVRDGFSFRHVPVTRQDKSAWAEIEQREANRERIVEFLQEQSAKGIKLSRNDLDGKAEGLGMTRDQLRTALRRAMQLSQVHEAPLPVGERVGRRTKFLVARGIPANPPIPAESRRGGNRTQRRNGGGIPADVGTSKRRRECGKAPKPGNTGKTPVSERRIPAAAAANRNKRAAAQKKAPEPVIPAVAAGRRKRLNGAHFGRADS